MPTQPTTLTRTQITVEVSADGLRAIIHLPSELSGQAIPRDDINEAMLKAGVVTGLRDDDIARVMAGVSEPITVAQGTPATHGKDGTVETSVHAKPPRPQIDDKTRADHRDTRLIQNVTTGQVVARILPPQPGVPGVTVRGTPIAPREGKRSSFRPGTNTAWQGADKMVIVATADGNGVLHEGESVDVQPVVTIDGDIDFATGNIDFVGSLIVRGDVKSDFIIKAKKSVDVFGNLEDTLIEAGEDVTIRKGFIGHGKGKILAKGNVKLSHVLNQSVVAGKDIFLEKESVNGSLKAGAKIVGPRAVIAGGWVEAEEQIEIGILGSSDGQQAKARVGKRGRIIERLGVIEKEAKAMEKQLLEIKDAVYKLIKLKIDVVTLPPEKEQILAKLQEAQKQLPLTLTAYAEEKKALNAELAKATDARIVVRDTVYENVLIDVNGARKILESALRDCIFVEHGGVVEQKSS